jgi:hypothetical protein
MSTAQGWGTACEAHVFASDHGLPLLKHHLMETDKIADYLLKFVFAFSAPCAEARFIPKVLRITRGATDAEWHAMV